MTIVSFVSLCVIPVLILHILGSSCAFQPIGVGKRGVLAPSAESWQSSVSKSLVSLNAVKDKKVPGDKKVPRDISKQGSLFFANEPARTPQKSGEKSAKNTGEADEENDNRGLTAAAATGTTLAAARTATTITGGIAATTASVTTTGSTSVGTTVSTIGAARSATTLVSSVAATTASVTSGSTTGTLASSGMVGARIGTTIASGVGASSITAASSSSTVGTVVAPAMAGTRAATGLVGVTAIASGSGGTSSTTAAGSLVGARVTSTVGSGVGAVVAGKSTSGLAAAGKVGGATRTIPYFATATTSSTAAIKGGAVSRLAGAGAAVLASGDIDALSGGALVVDSSATPGFGEALAGAASEMFGDASAFVGDAMMDGISTVGTAVADAAIGVATDAAIGSGTVWGIWDGLHRVLPSWLFTGGAAVLGSEIAFALFALFVASGTWGETQSETQQSEEPVGVENGLSFSAGRQADNVSRLAVVAGRAVPPKDIDTSEVLADVEEALKAADEILNRSLDHEKSKLDFVIGDTVKIVGGKDFRGKTAVVLSERGVNSGYWNLRVDGDNGPVTIHRKYSNLMKLPDEYGILSDGEFDRKELAQRKLLEARIRYEIRYLPRD